jgi:hypothetical protein
MLKKVERRTYQRKVVVVGMAVLYCIVLYLSVESKGQLGNATGDFVKVYRFGTTVAFDYMHRHVC